MAGLSGKKDSKATFKDGEVSAPEKYSQDDYSSINLNALKPEGDTKQYRLLQLENGLNCLLISEKEADFESESDDDDSISSDADNSDVESEMESLGSSEGNEGSCKGSSRRRAAVAMGVGVGSYSDPKQCQGLAHFLEHLLFMGSEKYPKENYFDEYVSSKGGFVNAFTQAEETIYYFTISQKGLMHALDIISQFLVQPLLNKNAIDRELDSIQSEFDSARMSDSNRRTELLSFTCKKTHPLSLFGWGNLSSIKEEPERDGIDPYELLKQFYDKYYGSDNMSLVVLGACSLEELEEAVRKSFTDIRKSKSGPCSHKEAGLPFTPRESGAQSSSPSDACISRLLYIVPVRETHVIHLVFQLPCVNKFYRSKPDDYLAHLIGHESEGSLLALAREKGWANTTLAGPSSGTENTAYTLFKISLSLTEKGVRQWVDVVSLVFEYIGLLLKEGPQEWIHNELQKIAEMNYRYKEEEDPDEVVCEFAEKLLFHHSEFEPKDILSGNELITEYRPDLIEEMLKTFTPDNVRIELISSLLGKASEYESAPIDTQTSKEPPKANSVGEVTIKLGSQLSVSEKTQTDEGEYSLFEKPEGDPSTEPRFGTTFWIETIPEDKIQTWRNALHAGCTVCKGAEGKEKLKSSSGMSLPKRNPYLASNFDMYPFDPEDSAHPIVGAAVKVNRTVSGKSIWSLGFVVQHSTSLKSVKIAFDFESSWHHVVDEGGWKRMLASQTGVKPSAKRGEIKFSLDDGKTKCRLVSGGFGAPQQFTVETISQLNPSSLPFAPCFSPQKLKKANNFVGLWFLRDRQFLLPRAEIYVSFVLKNRYSTKTPYAYVCRDLMVKMIREALNDEVYMASMAEYSCYISTSTYGLKLHLSGFTENIFKLCRKVVDELFGSLEPESRSGCNLNKRFSRIKESLKRGYSNIGIKSSSFAKRTRLECLQNHTFSREALIEALGKVDSLDCLKEYVTGMRRNGMFLDTYVHGNFQMSDVQQLHETLISLMKKHKVKELSRECAPECKVLHIPNGKPLLIKRHSIDEQERNNCVEAYFEIGEASLLNKGIADLIEHIMEEPLYDELRTNQQLGYHVSCSTRWNENIVGFLVKVVSATHSPDSIWECIRLFLISFFETSIKSLKKDREKYREHIETLAELKLADSVNMDEESGALWTEIYQGDCEFHRHVGEAAILSHITPSMVIEAYKKLIHPSSPDVKCLLVFLYGQGSSKTEPKLSNEIDEDNVLKRSIEVKNPQQDIHNGQFHYYSKVYAKEVKL